MAMTLIEGIGDEVIEFFIGLIIVVIGAVAWWSTRIADRPVIRTVLVFERRSHSSATINHHHHHLHQSGAVVEERRSTSTSDQRDYVQDLATVPLESGASGEHSREEENKPPETTRSNLEENNSNCNHLGNGSGDDNPDISSTSRIEEDEQRDILESMDSEDACVLRRRRLDFFQNNRTEPLITSSSSNSNVDNNIHNEEITETADEKPNLQNAENATSSPEINNLEAEEDIRIKLKYINDDLKMVNGKLKEPLGDFKRRHFEYELNNDKLVRLIFNGQVLQRDDLTLQGCGLFDNCVVHCLVHQKKPNTSDRNASNSNINSGNNSTSSGSNSSTNSDRPRMASNGHNQGRDRDLGNLFFAIITFLLGAAWYFRYEYAQLYTVTATVALVGLTGIFTVLLVGMYYPENPVQPVRS